MSAEVIDILSSDEEGTAEPDKEDNAQNLLMRLDRKPQVLTIEESPNKNAAEPQESFGVDNMTNKVESSPGPDSGAQSTSAKKPEDLAESRRRKIDVLLNNFERAQFRLQTVESMMDAAQKLRWDRLRSNNTNNNDNQTSDEASNSPMKQDDRSPPPSFAPNRSALTNGTSGLGFQRPPWFIDPPSSFGPTSIGASGSSTYSSRRTSTTTPKSTYKRRFKKKRTATNTKRRTSSAVAKRVSGTATSLMAKAKATARSMNSKSKVSRKPAIKVKCES